MLRKRGLDKTGHGIKGDDKTREELLEARLQDVAQLPANFFEPPAAAQSFASRRCLIGTGRPVNGGKNLIKKVQPIYPVTAKYSHIEGTVVFGATIEKDGRVAD